MSESSGAPCGGEGCFDGADFEVIPRGRWRNMPITKACKKCSKRMADAYTTRAGERGWADLEPISAPEKKSPAQKRVKEREQRQKATQTPSSSNGEAAGGGH